MEAMAQERSYRSHRRMEKVSRSMRSGHHPSRILRTFARFSGYGLFIILVYISILQTGLFSITTLLRFAGQVPSGGLQSPPLSSGKYVNSTQVALRDGQDTTLYVNLFQDYDPLNARNLTLSPDNKEYFYWNGTMPCLKEGTSTQEGEGRVCTCLDGWYGDWCSFPRALQSSDLQDLGHLSPRQTPRRVIYASPFNIEFEMLEARFNELGDIVDVFLLMESNYSAFGEPKPLRLLEALRDGSFLKWHHKIVYLFISDFPEGGRRNGWIADTYHKDVLGTKGMRQIQGTDHEDLFIYGDLDELARREVVLFLKLHSGYREPIRLNLWHTVFGFFLQSKPTELTMVCTVGMLAHVLQYKSTNLRKWRHGPQRGGLGALAMYVKGGGHVGAWRIGAVGNHAGWHCSWCLKAEGIRIKLISAQNGDFPRWGSYPEKCKLDYIKSLVTRAVWFDEKSRLERVQTETPGHWTPRYMARNKHRFMYLYRDVYSSKELHAQKINSSGVGGS